ncbi:MAG: hypothetical protein QOI60_186 [Actinomycetota bacterium]|jgi:hypothetical protein|nr:hypothetical protein [Actinomycetota bacterium]MEA2579625.1 hypothetical protein [Actinomycetota bacterium]
MAQVISLDSYRERRDPLAAAMARLDGAIGRLDPLVRGRRERPGPRLERELAAISREVSNGRPQAAADRAERLADLLEHPAAIGSSP